MDYLAVMSSFRRGSDSAKRPSLRGSLSAGPPSRTDISPQVGTSSPFCDEVSRTPRPGEYTHSPYIRRAASYVHFREDPTIEGSTTTLVGSGAQDIKRRQPYAQDKAEADDSEGGDVKRKASTTSIGGYKQRVQMLRRQSREIFEHVERKSSHMFSYSCADRFIQHTRTESILYSSSPSLCCPSVHPRIVLSRSSIPLQTSCISMSASSTCRA